MTKAGKKRKKVKRDPIETITIRGPQRFKLHNQINPIQITTDVDRIVNLFRKRAKVYYKFTPMGILEYQLKTIQSKYFWHVENSTTQYLHL